MRCVRRATPLFAAWFQAVSALLSNAPPSAPAWQQPDSGNSDPPPGEGENQDTESFPSFVTPAESQEWLDTEPKFTPEERIRLTKGTNGTKNLCLDDRILPEVLVIGAYRGGTTTLCSALRYSPSILFPLAGQKWEGNAKFPSRWKEGHHFDRHLSEGIDYMLDDYGPCDQSVRLIGVDGTVGYSVEYKTPANIKYWYGPLFQRLNLIFILREPLSRLHSHYYNSRALSTCSDLTRLSFLGVAQQILRGNGAVVWTGTSRSIHGPQCGAFLEASMYVRIINRFFVYFPPSQFTFLPFQLNIEPKKGQHPAQMIWERLGAKGLIPPALHMNARDHPTLEDDLPPQTFRAMRTWFAERTGPDRIAYRISNTTAILPGFAGDRTEASVAAWIRENW